MILNLEFKEDELPVHFIENINQEGGMRSIPIYLNCSQK
jgi:hypothetical protein